jgi:hypothetical protein
MADGKIRNTNAPVPMQPLNAQGCGIRPVVDNMNRQAMGRLRPTYVSMPTSLINSDAARFVCWTS